MSTSRFKIIRQVYLLLAVIIVLLAGIWAGRHLGIPFSQKYADVVLLVGTLLLAALLLILYREIKRVRSVYAEIKVREEYLSETLNSLEEGVITTDPDGIIWGMNPSAERLTHWGMRESIGQPLEQVYHVVNEETGKPIQNIVSRILKSGQPIAFENNTILRKKNADEIIISNNGSPIKDAKGNTIGSVLVFRDITEHIKLTEEKKDLTNRLLLATKSAGMGIWSWDIKKNILSWDETVCRLYNIDNSLVQSMYDAWIQKLHPEDKSFVQEEIQLALSGERAYETEFRILWDDASVRYIKASGIVERDKDGNPIRMIGTNWDITDKKKAEEDLRKSDFFNRAILNSLSSHIAVIDQYGTIVATSESWKKFAEENEDATLKHTQTGVNYFKVCEIAISMGDQLAEAALSGILGVMNDLTPDFYMEYPCHAPGEKRWFGMHVTKFDGDRLMVVIEHQNITPRKLAEAEREKITHDLILHNKNMEQFSYMVSHNLRAPLANIIGLGELLKEDDADTGELVKGITSAAYQLDEVVKEMNDILQLKTRPLENPEEVYFDDLIQDISQNIEHTFNTRDITIQTDFKSAGRMFTVKKYMHNIFYHLIHNSIKYQKPGAGVTIQIVSQPTANGIQIKVKDNGLGIDLLKYRKSLFGAYKRFHLHTEGKGLGLYMVKTYVETLGGKISVHSEVDEGAEFIIDFDTP